MKLSNFFVGNVFTISQSPHGVNTKGNSIDAVPTTGNRVLAPCDMDIYERHNGLGSASYSYAKGDGFILEFVHLIMEKSGRVKRGEDIGYLCPTIKDSKGKIVFAMHLHITPQITQELTIRKDGNWDIVLNYMDRNIQLALTSGFTSQHWKSWSTWKDLTLGKTTVEILKQTYEEAKSGFNDLFGFFEAHNIRADLAKYVKDGGDSVSWMIHNGRTELRGMFDVLVKERASLKASAKATELVLKAQNDQITELQRKIDEDANEDLNKPDKIEYLGKQVNTLTSEKETLLTEKKALIKAYAKCQEGKQGNKEDYIKLLRKLLESLRELFRKIGRRK